MKVDSGSDQPYVTCKRGLTLISDLNKTQDKILTTALAKSFDLLQILTQFMKY